MDDKSQGDTSHGRQYHECGFCQAITLDTDERLHADSGAGETFPDVFFLGPTLAELLAARAFCDLARWLLAEWARGGTYYSASTTAASASGPFSALSAPSPCCDGGHLTPAEWADLRARGDHVLLCARLAYWDRISWIGLWDADLEDMVESVAGEDDDWVCQVVRSERGLSVYVPEGKQQSIDSDLAVCSRRTDDPHAVEGLLSGPINLKPGSEETLARIRTWISRCIEEHGDCTGRDGAFMPEIVLRVARRGDAAAYDVSIHFPSEVGEPYVALSYCWGGDQPYKTTRARIRSEYVGLDWHSLPTTIQDAVKVTVGLGFQYLWVDSLCIVQDDAQFQKARHIAQMPQIYSNAVVTLAASKSSRAADGFLSHVDIRSLTRLAVKLRYADRNNSIFGDLFLVEFKDDLDTEPLDLRGWTFQERHLSTRIVDFEARCVSWSCLSEPPGRIRDGWGLFQPKSSSSKLRAWYALRRLRDADGHAKERPRHTVTTQGCTRASCTAPSDEHYQTVLEEFYSVVSDYTERVLSIPQDRILAVSGMAEMFGAILEDDYAVGLWRRSLPAGLLWNISRFSGDVETGGDAEDDEEEEEKKKKHPHHLHPRPPLFQAPSWSWAAVNGRVSTFHQTLALIPAVADLDVRVQLVEPTARYGAARWGRLAGRGRLRRALWSGAGRSSSSWRRGDLYALHDDRSEPSSSGSGEGGSDDGRDESPFCREIPLLRMIPDAIEDFDRDMSAVQSSDSLEDSFVEVHLLQIGVFGWNEETLERQHPIGLVLREMNDPAGEVTGPTDTSDYAFSPRPRRFTRLGMFTVDSWLWGEAAKAGDQGTVDLPRLFFSGYAPERFEIF